MTSVPGQRLTAVNYLEGLPDPVPRILSSRLTGLVWMGIQTAALCTLLGYLALSVFTLPQGWFVLAATAAAGSIVLATSYTRTYGRQPAVLSYFDLVLSVGFRMVQYCAVASVATVLWYAYKNGVTAEAFKGKAVLGMALINALKGLGKSTDWITAVTPNFFHLACALPLVRPTIGSWRKAFETRVFARELAAREEGKIARLLAKAGRLQKQGQSEEAVRQALQAQALLLPLLACTEHAALIYHRRLLREKIASLQGHAVSAEFRADPFGEGSSTMPMPAGGGALAGQADHGYDQYREFLESLCESANVSWSDVAGLDDVVGEIKSAFVLAMAQAPDGVQLDPPRRILLYGPPGTGKTLLTAAVSSSVDAPFFNVRVSDVLSKFFGESTRLVSALFMLARERNPAILFFDEIESICAKRDGAGMDGEERRMVSALLAELDGLKGKGSHEAVFTIAATNLPWQLDSAVLSRFEKQCYIPLPDDAARRRILELHLTGKGLQSGVPLDILVRHTRGYSGRELRRLCQEAIRLMTDDANPHMENALDGGRKALGQYRIAVHPISHVHFNAAFRSVRPQTPPDLLRRYEEWQTAH